MLCGFQGDAVCCVSWVLIDHYTILNVLPTMYYNLCPARLARTIL